FSSSCRLLLSPPRTCTLFPSTTLFRSHPPRLHRLHLARVDHRELEVRREIVDRRIAVGLELERPLALDAVQLAHVVVGELGPATDRKSTRLNSSHEWISYAVFCLKKKS